MLVAARTVDLRLELECGELAECREGKCVEHTARLDRQRRVSLPAVQMLAVQSGLPVVACSNYFGMSGLRQRAQSLSVDGVRLDLLQCARHNSMEASVDASCYRTIRNASASWRNRVCKIPGHRDGGSLYVAADCLHRESAQEGGNREGPVQVRKSYQNNRERLLS
jgi:hypothetical protein